MGITKIRPVDQELIDLMDNDEYLDGQIEAQRFDQYELDAIYSGSGLLRKFKRDISLGHTEGDYSAWQHLKAEAGYSIWKYPLTGAGYAHSNLNQLTFDGKAVDNRGEADAEDLVAFDKVYVYQSGYTDVTSEAGTEGGTAFSLISSTAGYLYIGDNDKFEGIDFDFSARGSNYTLKVEYYNGTSWQTLTSTNDGLSDNTANFTTDGRITFNAPSNWAKTTVNSSNYYWIRISTTATPSTTATCNFILPTYSVINLLSLEADDITDEKWAWAYYNNFLYVTIRNSGKTYYEGNYHITPTAGNAMKKNFFVYNHEFKLSYLSSEWSQTLKYGFAVEFTDGSGGNASVGHIACQSGAGTAALATAHGTSYPAIGFCVGGSGSGFRHISLGAGLIDRCKVEDNITISAGQKLYLSTGTGLKAGRVTNVSPSYPGSISQFVGRAWNDMDTVKKEVIVIQHIEWNYTEN